MEMQQLTRSQEGSHCHQHTQDSWKIPGKTPKWSGNQIKGYMFNKSKGYGEGWGDTKVTASQE